MKKENDTSIFTTVEEIFKFITDEYLQKRIILQCIINDNFNKDVSNLIHELNKKMNDKIINTIFNNIHSKTVKYLNLVKNCSKPNRHYGKTLLLALSYFYLLEAFDEHCKLNDKTIKEIKNTFGAEYLNIISSIDKTFLSKDIQKVQIKVEENSYSKSSVTEECLEKYIVFKEWQDKQHSFYYEEIEEFTFTFLKQCFDDCSTSDDLENTILTKMVMEKITKEKIVPIEIICLLSKLDMKKEILSFFGGKSYGLARLKAIQAEIPWTAAIPIGKKITYEQLNTKIPKNIQYFSVRSSADIEDGENHSFAGMFDSYLNIKRKDLVEYFEKVKKSTQNSRLKSYLIKNNLEKPHMAVIIQAFEEPQISGVWLGNSLNSGMLEYTKGNGEKLVSGKVIPQNEIFKSSSKNKDTIKIQGEAVGDLLIKMQKKLKTISDFEWMILNDKLVMLQFRPVTVKVKNLNNKNVMCSNNVISGLACSGGKVEGTVQFLNSPKEKFKAGNILLAWITDPDWIPHMMKAKGVITASGGFLCHAGIVSRELGIPCVTGVGGDVVKRLSVIKDLKVVLDGDKGTITIK